MCILISPRGLSSVSCVVVKIQQVGSKYGGESLLCPIIQDSVVSNNPNISQIVDKLKNCASNACLFFNDDKIIVKTLDMSFRLPFQKTVEDLELKILSLNVNGELPIVKCKIGLSTQDLSNSPYTVYSVKKFLTQVTTDCHRQILKSYHKNHSHFTDTFTCGDEIALIEDYKVYHFSVTLYDVEM